MKKFNKNIIKIIFNVLLFAAILVFVMSPIHENVHASALDALGYKFIRGGNLFHPTVTCTSCQNASNIEMFWFSFAPYIIDLLLICLGALFYDGKILRYLMHLGYADIVGNYIALFFYYLNNNIIHDFINMAKTGFWYIPIFLFAVSTFIWFSVNWNWVKEKFHEIREVYRDLR